METVEGSEDIVGLAIDLEQTAWWLTCTQNIKMVWASGLSIMCDMVVRGYADAQEALAR